MKSFENHLTMQDNAPRFSNRRARFRIPRSWVWALLVFCTAGCDSGGSCHAQRGHQKLQAISRISNWLRKFRHAIPIGQTPGHSAFGPHLASQGPFFEVMFWQQPLSCCVAGFEANIGPTWGHLGIPNWAKIMPTREQLVSMTSRSHFQSSASI